MAVLLLYLEVCDLHLCKRSHKSFALTDLQQASSLDLSDGDIICVLLFQTSPYLRLACTYVKLFFLLQTTLPCTYLESAAMPIKERRFCRTYLTTIIRQPPVSPHHFPGQAILWCVLNPAQRLSPETA